MRCSHPQEISPLGYAPALVLGLMMILGLPSAAERRQVAPARTTPTEVAQALKTHRAVTSMARP